LHYAKVITNRRKKDESMLKFLKDESGAKEIEYGLIAAAMGLGLVSIMPTLANSVKGKMGSLAGHVTSGK
jgi:pilus assembly protein Flp/PilA